MFDLIISALIFAYQASVHGDNFAAAQYTTSWLPWVTGIMYSIFFVPILLTFLGFTLFAKGKRLVSAGFFLATFLLAALASIRVFIGYLIANQLADAKSFADVNIPLVSVMAALMIITSIAGSNSKASTK